MLGILGGPRRGPLKRAGTRGGSLHLAAHTTRSRFGSTELVGHLIGGWVRCTDIIFYVRRICQSWAIY